MRMINCLLSFWAKGMVLMKYWTHLRYLQRFGSHLGVQPLQPSVLLATSIFNFTCPHISSVGRIILHTIRKGIGGESQRIGFNTLCQIKSTASLCHVLDMQNAFPRQALQDRRGRGLIHEYASPCTEMNMAFTAKNMSCRLGTATEKSWSITHVHVT